MIEVKYGELSALMTDLIDASDGFKFFRMVGPEVTTGAFWAALVSKDFRDDKWKSEVRYETPKSTYSSGVACAKDYTYKTIKTKLANGMVDLAMLHPHLTLEEDGPKGFYIFTYDNGIPVTFFNRLQRSLSVPILPEWTEWLWEEGQKEMKVPRLTERLQNDNSISYSVAERKPTPITKLETIVGEGHCYRIRCQDSYEQAWLRIIRKKMNWHMPLEKLGAVHYRHGQYEVRSSIVENLAVGLYENGIEIEHNRNMDTLMAIADQKHGLNFSMNGGKAYG